MTEVTSRSALVRAAANLTSVAVRLVPLGQTAGLEVLRDLARMRGQWDHFVLLRRLLLLSVGCM